MAATQRLLAQTDQRLAGDRVIPDRLVSLADPDARPIRKGKPGGPTEFGYTLLLAEEERGFVCDHQLQRGNPPDAPQLVPAVQRVIGVTGRRKTSPNTFRWQQDAEWTRRLPARAVRNVSLRPVVCSYFGDNQVKLTRSYHPHRWLADAEGPDRDEETCQALAEAAALVSHGRSRAERQALARATTGEPALAEPWLRSLVGALNS